MSRGDKMSKKSKSEEIKEMLYDITNEGELYNIGNVAFMLAEYLEHQKKKKNNAM